MTAIHTRHPVHPAQPPIQLKHVSSSLAALAIELNQESDKINQVINEVNVELEWLRVGIQVWIPAKVPVREFGYTWTVESWQLAYRAEDGAIYPLIKASREIRLAGLEVLPTLLAILEDEMSKLVKTLNGLK